VGDFNSWRTNELRMTRIAGGYWRARIILPPGEYRFKYFADGNWFVDYAAFGVESSQHGIVSVLWVRNNKEIIYKGDLGK
jgi:hypothetical protein